MQMRDDNNRTKVHFVKIPSPTENRVLLIILYFLINRNLIRLRSSQQRLTLILIHFQRSISLI